MSTPEDVARTEAELRTKLTELLRPSDEELYRTGKPFEFTALRSIIEPMRNAARLLQSAPLDRLSYPQLADMTNAFEDLLSGVRQILGFNDLPTAEYNSATAAENRRDLVRKFERQFWESVSPPFAVAMAMSTDALSVREAVAKAIANVEESRGAIAAYKVTAGEVVSALQQSAANTGVDKHAALFADEAVAQDTGSKVWLRRTAIAATVTLVFAVTNFVLAWWKPSDATAGALVQLVAAKLVLLSVLLSATIWCGRMYRAARHNFTVNKHRQNALSSFRTFVAATGDDLQTRNALLLHVAQGIFMPQATGYSDSDGESGSTAHLVELVRTIGPAKT
jgi:hypothetical protein